MSDKSPGEVQILELLASLQKAVGEDFTKLEAQEIAGIRAILRHRETLINMAKYDEAKGLFWRHWRGAILAAGAVLSALVFLASTTSDFLSKLWSAFQ